MTLEEAHYIHDCWCNNCRRYKPGMKTNCEVYKMILRPLLQGERMCNVATSYEDKAFDENPYQPRLRRCVGFDRKK